MILNQGRKSATKKVSLHRKLELENIQKHLCLHPTKYVELVFSKMSCTEEEALELIGDFKKFAKEVEQKNEQTWKDKKVLT